MTGEFSGKYALVTGASRGIGAAVAKELARRGAHVILLARTQGGLEEVDDAIQSFGGKATLIPMDLARLDNIDKLGPSIAERFGALDIFVGNAGILGTLGPVNHTSPKEWDKVMKVNFMANVHLVRTLDPLLRASAAGRVVFTTTDLVELSEAYWGPYTASKAALNSLALAYAAETRKTNMRINLVRPGVVDTKLLKDAFPGGFPGDTKTPDEVVGAFMGLLGADCTRHGEIVIA